MARLLFATKGMLSEVAHMYPAYRSARGPWPSWEYARTIDLITGQADEQPNGAPDFECVYRSVPMQLLMRQRSPEAWGDWLARDRTFSTQPYMQLSSVLAAAGYRGTADDIQVAQRERERSEAWRQRNLLYWGWQTILWFVVGYGIGLYTFSVLIWVVGFTGLGAGVLWYSPNARARGYLWQFGASLHRLLPIAEVSKEFKNFFDEPSNLGRFQCLYFAVHAMTGWALGLFLLAAMGGLMQKG